MSAPADPFRVLSLPYDAGPDDARRAFRRRARETHPDRGGSTAAFQAVREAYDVLAADLEAQRRRWRPAPSAPAPAPAAPRFAGGLDPREFPTCPVRIGRRRDGRRELAFDGAARPRGWRPGPSPPPGGTLADRLPATEAAPAAGVWTVPTGRHTFRCVFGPLSRSD